MTDPRLEYAKFYLWLGWNIFVLSSNKNPVGNCQQCWHPIGTPSPHDGLTCPHLTCHAYQAASGDLSRVAAMLAAVPGGHLAVACGRRSMMIMLDGEATDLGENSVGWGISTGADLLRSWEQEHGWSLPAGVPWARSISGGLHVPVTLGIDDLVPTRRLIQHALDLQSDGSYAALPDGTSGREWLSWPGYPCKPPLADYHLIDYLNSVPRKVFKTPRGGGRKRMVEHQDGPMPPDTEFLESGLGCWTGTRHDDAYKLGWRYAGRKMSEQQAMELLGEVWEMSVQDGETWEKVWGHCQAGMADQARKKDVQTVLTQRFMPASRFAS